MRDLGITGSRAGASKAQRILLREILYRARALGYGRLHHGDCLGVDEEADIVAKDLGYKTILHPPLEKRHRANTDGHELVHPPLSYLDRNWRIVEASEVVIAFPSEINEVRRSGTWATVRYARHARVTCMIVSPYGAIRVEDNV